MGTVHQLSASRENATLGEAAAAYLASLDHPESAGTRRVYGSTVRALVAEFGTEADAAGLRAAAVSAWFTRAWGGRRRRRGTATGTRCAASWSTARRRGGSVTPPDSPAAYGGAGARRTAPGRCPAPTSRSCLPARTSALRERTLWRMLYETAARSAEVLRLDVEDLDLPNRRVKVRRKGGAIDVIVWQTATARLLPRLLKGRKSGPLFLTDRRARVELPPGDIDPASGRARLSYRQAEALFKEASGGATLHQLRHSALTHDAEDGASRPCSWPSPGTPVWQALPATPGRPPRPWRAGRHRGTRPGGAEPAGR